LLATVDETIVDAAADEKEDTEIKQADADESLEAPTGEQSRNKTPSPARHMLTIVAEAGGSARHLLAHIRARNKKGTSGLHGRRQDFWCMGQCWGQTKGLAGKRKFMLLNVQKRGN